MNRNFRGGVLSPRERNAFLPEATALRLASLGRSLHSTLHLDWERFLRLGVHHRLLPAVEASALGSALPGRVRRALAAARLFTMRRQTRLLAVARLAVDAVEDAGIPCVVLGGPAMFSRLYAPGTRYCTDVDVLVPPRALPRARRALFRAGARRWRPAYANLLVTDDVTIDLHGHPTEAGRIFAVRHAFRLSTRDVLARRRLVEAPGFGEMPIPDPADEVLIAAAHFHKHCFGRWLWGLDLARALASFTGDAQQRLLARRVGAGRFGSVFADVGLVLRALFQVSLPPALARELPPARSPLRRWALSRALDGRLGRAGDVLLLEAIKHPALRLRYGFELLFPHARVVRETRGLHWRAEIPLRERMARAGAVARGLWTALKGAKAPQPGPDRESSERAPEELEQE